MLESSQSSANYTDVSKVITEKILTGELKRGDRLPTERELAKALQVSRPSVREAVKALQLMGILECRQGRGTYVTGEPENTINDPLAIVYALSDASFLDLQQFRMCLESEACRNIILYSSDEEIGTLLPYLEEELYQEGNFGAMAENDAAFHAAIIDMSNNVIIKYLYKTLWMLINKHIRKILLATSHQKELDVVRTDHIAMYRALKNRSLQELGEALSHHLYLNEDYRALMGRTEL